MHLAALRPEAVFGRHVKYLAFQLSLKKYEKKSFSCVSTCRQQILIGIELCIFKNKDTKIRLLFSLIIVKYIKYVYQIKGIRANVDYGFPHSMQIKVCQIDI